MTREGALDLIRSNGDIRTRGWEPPRPEKFPLKTEGHPITGVPGGKPQPASEAATKKYVDSLAQNIKVISNPAQAKPGDLYYDTTDNKLKLMTDTGWVEVKGTK